MDDRDVYRSAKLLIDQYGAAAPVQAAMRADAMLERGDLNSAAAWKRIATAIFAIQSTEGETIHRRAYCFRHRRRRVRRRGSLLRLPSHRR